MVKEKKYKIKPTKKQLGIIKMCWLTLKRTENKFYSDLMLTEEFMEKETGIKGIEFFRVDGEYVGVGNSNRTMKLIQMEDN